MEEKINYVRLAVTDRCNLRCFYCMPEEGIDWLARTELMSYEEMLRICSRLLVWVLKDPHHRWRTICAQRHLAIIDRFIQAPGLQHLTLTTNGVLTAPHVPELKK